MRWRQEHTLHISLVRVEFRRSPVRRQLAQVCWKGLVCWGSGMAAESGWHRTSPPAVPMSKPGTQPSSTLDIIARHVAAITPATARPCSKVLLPPSSHHLSCAQSTLIPPFWVLEYVINGRRRGTQNECWFIYAKGRAWVCSVHSLLVWVVNTPGTGKFSGLSASTN